MKKKKENPEPSDPRAVEVSAKIPSSSSVVSKISGNFPIEDIVKAFVYLAGSDFYSRIQNIDSELKKIDEEIVGIEKKIAALEGEISRQRRMLEERKKIRGILEAVKVNFGGGGAQGA